MKYIASVFLTHFTYKSKFLISFFLEMKSNLNYLCTNAHNIFFLSKQL